MTEQHFVLKPNGKIYWIQEPVKVPAFASSTRGIGRYNHALQYAIDNAVEVSNFDETEDALLDAHATGHGFRLEVGKVYSLQCSVEIQECKGGCKNFEKSGESILICHDNGCQYKTALVTFSQPEREETQEQIFDDLFCQYLDCIYNKEMSGYTANIEIQRRFTITRKTP